MCALFHWRCATLTSPLLLAVELRGIVIYKRLHAVVGYSRLARNGPVVVGKWGERSAGGSTVAESEIADLPAHFVRSEKKGRTRAVGATGDQPRCGPAAAARAGGRTAGTCWCSCNPVDGSWARLPAHSQCAFRESWCSHILCRLGCVRERRGRRRGAKGRASGGRACWWVDCQRVCVFVQPGGRERGHGCGRVANQNVEREAPRAP